MKTKKDKIFAFLLALCCSAFGTTYAQYDHVRKGDIIDIHGKKAIVFAIDEDGHGSAMYVGALRGEKNAWCANTKYASGVYAYSEIDGKANTQAVYDYVQSNGVSLTQFPAFEWCRSLGEGWYIPSLKQMEVFVHFLLGNNQDYDWDSEEDFDIDAETLTTKHINVAMLEAGGIPFISSASGSTLTSGVYTSTKTHEGDVYLLVMDPSNNVWRFRIVPCSSIGKYTIGRAFYDF